MFSLLYDIILGLISLISFPRFILRYRKNPLFKQALKQKLGLNFPKFAKDTKVIWVHAISMGEVKAVVKLVDELKAHYSDHEILVSTATLTGHEEAKKWIKAASHVVFLPIDISFIIKRVMNQIHPSLVILVESDFCYQFMKEAKREGASIVLVNGKLSEKSQMGYRLLPGFSKILFRWIDLYLLQSIDYVDRFLTLGIPEEKILTTGNLKLDNEPKIISPEDKQSLIEKLKLKKKTIIFGSTHQGEESLALDACEALFNDSPDVKVIIVPRHPERFDAVAEMIQKRNIPFYRYSQKEPIKDEQLILVDTMGILGSLYQVSDIAVVCGSFTEHVGGHNIIEPLVFKVPVLFGPHMHKQPEFTLLVTRYQAGIQVKANKLTNELQRLLQDEEACLQLGVQGLKLVNENRGATQKTAFEISNFFCEKRLVKK